MEKDLDGDTLDGANNFFFFFFPLGFGTGVLVLQPFTYSTEMAQPFFPHVNMGLVAVLNGVPRQSPLNILLYYYSVQ